MRLISVTECGLRLPIKMTQPDPDIRKKMCLAKASLSAVFPLGSANVGIAPSLWKPPHDLRKI